MCLTILFVGQLQAVYGFNFAGRPDLTQRWVRHLVQTKYTVTSDGITGNDDYGTMSAWLVFSALGIYPLPCQRLFALGSPSFNRVVVRRGAHAAPLTIVAHNNSDANVYVERVTVNGEQVVSANWTVSADVIWSPAPVFIEFYMTKSFQ